MTLDAAAGKMRHALAVARVAGFLDVEAVGIEANRSAVRVSPRQFHGAFAGSRAVCNDFRGLTELQIRTERDGVVIWTQEPTLGRRFERLDVLVEPWLDVLEFAPDCAYVRQELRALRGRRRQATVTPEQP